MAITPFERVPDDAIVAPVGTIWNRLIQNQEDFANLDVVYPLKIEKRGGLMQISLYSTPSNLWTPVILVPDGGSNGSAGTTATYTYTAYAITDTIHATPLATNLPLFFRRLFLGPCLPAELGVVLSMGAAAPTGFTGTAGNDPDGGTTPLRLMFADEQFGTSVAIESCVP